MKDLFYAATGANTYKGVCFGQSGAEAQGTTNYYLFELIYAVPDNLSPIHTEKELTVVLEYPYPIEKLKKYLNISEYKEKTVKMVHESFPNSTIEFSGQDKNKLCELFSFVVVRELLKQNEGSKEEFWTYRYAIDFQEVYIVSKDCKCLMHVIIPKNIAETLMEYDAWEDFTTQVRFHIKMNLGVDFCEIDFPSAERYGKDQAINTIHIPLNHVVTEEHKLALDYWKERAQITKEFEPWLFEFIKDNAVTPATRREATFIKPENIESGFSFRLEPAPQHKKAGTYFITLLDEYITGRNILDLEPFSKYLYPISTMSAMGTVACIKVYATGYLIRQLAAMSMLGATISIPLLGIIIIIPTLVMTYFGEKKTIIYIKRLLDVDFKDSEVVINYTDNATMKKSCSEIWFQDGENEEN